MSILDKSFLQDLINLPILNNYDEFQTFLRDDDKVKTIFLNSNLLINMALGAGPDTYHVILFEYQKKYIYFEIFEGTCDGCIPDKCRKDTMSNTITDILETALEKVYVTANSIDIFTYVYNNMKQHEEDVKFYFLKWKNKYYNNNGFSILNKVYIHDYSNYEE
jgi:hypothetical protein